MKLWKLERPFEDVQYDENRGFIVRAETETEARRLVAECVEDRHVEDPEVWLSATESACVEIPSNGQPEIVLQDFKAG